MSNRLNVADHFSGGISSRSHDTRTQSATELFYTGVIRYKNGDITEQQISTAYWLLKYVSQRRNCSLI